MTLTRIPMHDTIDANEDITIERLDADGTIYGDRLAYIMLDIMNRYNNIFQDCIRRQKVSSEVKEIIRNIKSTYDPNLSAFDAPRTFNYEHYHALTMIMLPLKKDKSKYDYTPLFHFHETLRALEKLIDSNDRYSLYHTLMLFCIPEILDDISNNTTRLTYLASASNRLGPKQSKNNQMHNGTGCFPEDIIIIADYLSQVNPHKEYRIWTHTLTDFVATLEPGKNFYNMHSYNGNVPPYPVIIDHVKFIPEYIAAHHCMVNYNGKHNVTIKFKDDLNKVFETIKIKLTSDCLPKNVTYHAQLISTSGYIKATHTIKGEGLIDCKTTRSLDILLNLTGKPNLKDLQNQNYDTDSTHLDVNEFLNWRNNRLGSSLPTKQNVKPFSFVYPVSPYSFFHLLAAQENIRNQSNMNDKPTQKC